MNAYANLEVMPMTNRRPSSDAGFSLVELLVAMTITLIVSGAIYGLLSGGQSAFRREPELADRQQNIRIAMNLIMRDVVNAGAGMPPLVQAFRPGLDACTSTTLCPVDTGRVTSSEGNVTDELEILTNSEGRDSELVCHDPGSNNSSNVRLTRPSSVGAGSVVLLFTSDGRWTLRYVTNVATNSTGAANCDAGQNHTQLTFANGGDPTGLNTPSGPCEPNGWGNVPNPCTISNVGFAEVVRWRIRVDPSDNVPVLQRWSSSDPTGIAGGGLAAGGFKTVARGIEDLQVQYHRVVDPATTFTDNAPVIVPSSPLAATDYDNVVTQVQVTLVARSEARNIQGTRTSASGRVNLRGTLTSRETPRSALFNLANPSPFPPRWF